MRNIVIIGGGAAGLSAAAALAGEARVTLLEAEDALSYHSSGRSAAAFVPGYGNRLTQALIAAGRGHFKNNHLLSPRGMMLLAKAGEDATFEAEMAADTMTEITVEAALDMVPILNRDAVARVAVQKDVYDIDTDALLQGFTKCARANGAQIVTKARVTDIARDAYGWRVTAGEIYRADVIINAAGAWASEIAAMAGAQDIEITPNQRSVARVPAPEGYDVSGWPFLMGVDEQWYAKADAGAMIVSPAEEEPVPAGDAWAEDMVLAEGIARYEEMVTAQVSRMLSNWAGLRSFAPDRTFVLGADATMPSFIWCAGQGGNGIQTSPAAGRLIADVVLGRPPEIGTEIADALSPARFT